VCDSLLLLAAAVFGRERGRAYFLAGGRLVRAGIVVNQRTASSTAGCARRREHSTRRCSQPITGGFDQINVYGSINGANVYRQRMTGDPNHSGSCGIGPPLHILTPLDLPREVHRLRRWLMLVLVF